MILPTLSRRRAVFPRTRRYWEGSASVIARSTRRHRCQLPNHFRSQAVQPEHIEAGITEDVAQIGPEHDILVHTG